MPVSNPSQRWGLALAGHDFDLALWEDTLKPPFEPWVEKREIDPNPYVLFSSHFGELLTGSEVWNAARSVIAELNGAMALTCGAEALRIAAVLDFQSAPPKRHILIQPQSGRIRTYASPATISAYRADGTLISPPPPAPSSPQSWLTQTDQDGSVSDLLTYASRCDNWFDVYKLMEAAAQLAGGERKLEALCPGTKATKTAVNFHRHHRTHRPDPLIDFAEARTRAFAAARAVLDRFGSSPPNSRVG